MILSKLSLLKFFKKLIRISHLELPKQLLSYVYKKLLKKINTFNSAINNHRFIHYYIYYF